MIKFDFSFDKYFESSGYRPDHVNSECLELFPGQQTFIVNDVDFSYSETSILLFSWHIRLIQQWIAVGSKPYEMHILGNSPCLIFSKDADSIKIEQKRKQRSTCEIGLRTAVPALELSRAIKGYYQIPYKACCSMKMPADTMEAIKRWYYVDYISFLTCTVIRAIPEKKSYEVQIKEGGVVAEYVCVRDLSPGQEVIAFFGAAFGTSSLLTLTSDRELVARQDEIDCPSGSLQVSATSRSRKDHGRFLFLVAISITLLKSNVTRQLPSGV